jgi:hypothetical protein
MELPFLDAGDGGAVALVDAAPEAARALVATALGAHKLLPRVAPLGDALSRRWLERNRNPYGPEIAAVARRVGRPGVFLLNCVYEWACSTSAGPDRAGDGNRMIRVLDWGMKGIGRYAVMARHASAAGSYLAATWPGYAGVLTAMAPGRFAAAINQAPQQRLARLPVANEIAIRLDMLRRGGIPAAHLLRRVFETAQDFEAALAQLADPREAIAMPAIVTISGTGPRDAAVVELDGHRRALHRADAAAGWVVGVANDWLSDWGGIPRLHAHVRRPGETPHGNNAARRRLVCALHTDAFGGAGSLPPPVLNAHTVMVAVANARRGTFELEALDLDASGVPPVHATRRHAAL